VSDTLLGEADVDECLDYRHPFMSCACNWGKLHPNEPISETLRRRRTAMIFEAWAAGLVELES
jgi:hypothetical protein